MNGLNKQHESHPIALFANALESGTYPRTLATQRRTMPDGSLAYDPMGIACLVYHEQTGDGYWVDQEDGTAFFVAGNARCSHLNLPQPVADWLGIDPTERLGGYVAFGRQCFNDICDDPKVTFPMLAQALKMEFLPLNQPVS